MRPHQERCIAWLFIYLTISPPWIALACKSRPTSPGITRVSATTGQDLHHPITDLEFSHVPMLNSWQYAGIVDESSRAGLAVPARDGEVQSHGGIVVAAESRTILGRQLGENGLKLRSLSSKNATFAPKRNDSIEEDKDKEKDKDRNNDEAREAAHEAMKKEDERAMNDLSRANTSLSKSTHALLRARTAISDGRLDDAARSRSKASEWAAKAKQQLDSAHLGSVLSEQPPSAAMSKGLKKVAAACGTLVALGWYTIAEGMYTGIDDRYHLLPQEDGKQKYGMYFLIVAAVLYWVALPITNLVLGFYSTCDGGPPGAAYKAYIGFLIAHVGLALSAGCFFGFPALVETSYIQSFPISFTLMVLEHLDMSTDSLFTGSTEACSSEITRLWGKSWHQVPLVGGFIGPIVDEIGFSGLALTLFVTSAYIPQFVNIVSILNIAAVPIMVGMVCLWVWFDWIVGLTVIIASYAACRYFLPSPFYNWVTDSGQPHKFGLWSGITLFEYTLQGGSADDRLLFVGVTRVVFENLLQLWLQSSYFAASFDLMSHDAHVKAVLSLGVGFALAVLKLGSMMMAVTRFVGGPIRYLNYVGLALPMLFAIWVLAKVYYAFKCEHHIWNLFSGCAE